MERSGTALFGLARVSGLGMGTAWEKFIYQGFRGEPRRILDWRLSESGVAEALALPLHRHQCYAY